MKPIKILRERNKYKLFFYSVMAFSIAIFLFFGIISGGETFGSSFFSDRSDSFMDHFNSVVYNEADPYENYVIYPPLASFTYELCNKIIPRDVYNSIVVDPTIRSQPKIMKAEQSFIFQFVAFWIIAVFILLLAVDILKKGKKPEKIFYSIALIFAAPFMFMVERGNNLLIPLAFSMFFLAFYDSENKWLKEFALISLALAAGFKIYPIILGVLLVQKKQYKELIRAGIYCVITLILPFFLFYNGFESMINMVSSIAGFSSSRSSSAKIGTDLDFKRSFYFLCAGTSQFTGIKFDSERLEVYSVIFRYFCTLVCVAGTFFLRERWKVVMLCAAIIYGFPGSCASYLLTFFAPAIILLLDEEKKFSFWNFVYLACMTVTQISMIMPADGGWSRYWPTKITSAAVCAIVMFTFLELIVRFLFWNFKRLEKGVPFFKACGERINEFIPDELLEKLSARRMKKEAKNNV